MTSVITLNAPSWTTRRSPIAAPPRHSQVVKDELDGEAVLFDLRTGDTHRLNATALAVWSRCDGRTTMREIAAQLADRYEVDPEVALDDVEQLVTRLAESGLLDVERNA
jgi:PqqD family protein of HPr-rel-A system